jgi:hypothetical protein
MTGRQAAGWLLLLFAGMAGSFLLSGYFSDYWLHADQDFILAYQGLLYNDGLPQEYFDHPGYLSYLLLGNWYRLLHAISLLPVHALSAMPQAGDAAATAAAWESLVRAGRVLSLLMTLAFTAVFAGLIRRLAGDWRIAIMAAVAFGASASVVLLSRIMRTELLTGCLVVLAFLLLLIAARSPRMAWRPALVGVAALCAMLALENKLQALLPLLALPVLVAALGDAGRQGTSPWAQARWAWPAAGVAMLVAVALTLPAAELLVPAAQRMTSSVLPYRELPLGLSGLYPSIMALWFAGAMLAWSAWQRVPPAEVLAALACAASGIALGALALRIRLHEQNLIALTHPLEHLVAFVAHPSDVGYEAGAMAARLWSGLIETLRMHSYAPHRARPTILLEWFMAGAAVMAWRRGERRFPAGIAVLLATVIALEAAFTLRNLRLDYFIFTEPLVVVGAALSVMHFPGLIRHRWFPRGLVALGALLFAWANVEPARLLFHKREPRYGVMSTDSCGWAPYYLRRIERLPYCPPQQCANAGPLTCWRDGEWRIVPAGPGTPATPLTAPAVR